VQDGLATGAGSINSVSYSQWRSPPRMNLRQCSKLPPPLMRFVH
jgi:hypothetical protein